MGTIRCTFKELARGLEVPLDERTTIVVGPDAACCTLHGRLFDAGRSFPLPRALSALADAFGFAIGLDAKAALVVVHTNAIGDHAESDPLSLERAQILAAWLEGKPDRWLENYEEGVEESKRWGPREDHAMLAQLDDFPKVEAGALAASPNAGEQARVRDPVVRSYQASRDLSTDGIAGPITRKQLVLDYFALSRSARRSDAEDSAEPAEFTAPVSAHGAGEHFSLKQAQAVLDAPGSAERTAVEETAEEKAAQQNERIDFLFFMNEGPVEPAPGTPGGPEYLEWLKLVSLNRLVRVRATSASGETKIALELFDKTGRLRHHNQPFRISGPESFDGRTDAFGRIVLHEVPEGDYTLSLELTFLQDPHQFTDTYELPVVALGIDAARPQIRLIGAVPRCEMADLGPQLFGTNKSFLLPGANDELKKIRALYERFSPGHLLVVGHTDTTAEPRVNDPLSLERADATLAFLRDDVDSWLQFYESSEPESRRWGETEDLHMLRALPDFDDGEAGSDPVLWFQRTRGLKEDGVAGTQTRTQLIREYMARDGADLDDFPMQAQTHGCGENFPVDETGESIDEAPADGSEDALDRRVELFFFDNEFGVLPPPPGKNSPAGSTEYPEWRRRAQEEAAPPDFGGEQVLFRLHGDASTPIVGGRYRVIRDGATLFESNSEDGWAKIPRSELKEGAKLALQWSAPGASDFGFTLTLAPVFDQEVATERARARLKNLGYATASDSAFGEAVKGFERDYGLPIRGLQDDEVAEATVAVIDEIYAAECDATPPDAGADGDPGSGDGDGDDDDDALDFPCAESLEGEDAEEVRTNLSLHATDGDGNPIVGETVRVSFEDGSELEIPTDADGNASFDGVPAGKCRVSFPELPPGSWRLA